MIDYGVEERVRGNIHFVTFEVNSPSIAQTFDELIFASQQNFTTKS